MWRKRKEKRREEKEEKEEKKWIGNILKNTVRCRFSNHSTVILNKFSVASAVLNWCVVTIQTEKNTNKW
jgi:hypothetical protein